MRHSLVRQLKRKAIYMFKKYKNYGAFQKAYKIALERRIVKRRQGKKIKDWRIAFPNVGWFTTFKVMN